MADEEEMKGAGLMMGKRCLWDPETDQYVHALFKNDSIYCHTTISKFAKKVAPSSGFRCLFSNWGLILNITSSGYKKVVKTVTEFERQVE
ncbi:hypothetical protein MSG28_000179 [Choristoneura fumiferana]|uniref:Uncharacterized protein n=1 Tax=Choristoneura fumiferana TaxID=7141 RepID=A0ACC0JZX2_CHOFU|nr:hypothetical protein MSG28_000179 [Choristoneura fumiferana]